MILWEELSILPLSIGHLQVAAPLTSGTSGKDEQNDQDRMDHMIKEVDRVDDLSQDQHCHYLTSHTATRGKSFQLLIRAHRPMTQKVYNFVMYDGRDLSGLISDLKKQFGAHGALN